METQTTSNALKLIAQLSPDALRERIAELDREQRALRVLLRSATQRQRQVAHRQEAAK
ncbi:MAG: hypothetical protein ACYC35_28325 [Pirellulales bacterium]